jgi:hypothetical protein
LAEEIAQIVLSKLKIACTYLVKKLAKNFYYFEIFPKKLPKVNNVPRGENQPNVVTLIESHGNGVSPIKYLKPSTLPERKLC